LASARSGHFTESPAPYEVVLVGEKVVFDKAEKVSSEGMIRDLGVREPISAQATYFGFSVIWDGKEYKRKPFHGPWNGPDVLFPKAAMPLSVSLKDFPVPAQALMPGRHTIAVKDAFAESNTITVFIENTKNSSSPVKSP